MIAEGKQLSNPPVREAVIDIQFAPAVDLSVLEQFADAMASEFDRSSPMWRTEFGLQVGLDGAEPAYVAEIARHGLRLQSSQRPYVLQSRFNGLTLSRLPPYKDWHEFKDSGRRYWDKFAELVFSKNSGYREITRISLRYINALRLPMPLRDFSDYLRAPPEVPEPLPQALQSFLQRVVIPLQDAQSIAIVTQALEAPSTQTESITVILDIDVQRPARIDFSDKERLWNEMETLRVEKNRIFFAHITEKLLERLSRNSGKTRKPVKAERCDYFYRTRRSKISLDAPVTSQKVVATIPVSYDNKLPRNTQSDS